MKEFKNLKFQSVIPQDILQAVGLLEELGYEEVRSDFSLNDAAKHNGVCAWDDGEITEGWLDDDNFEQVTLEELKEMVGESVKDNIFTLERLLGCEVKVNYSGVTGYVTDIIDNGLCLHICCGNSFDVVGKYYLTFFTEDGDELTFDEYVKLYYPYG